jgi:hypothetical protein
MSEPLDNGMQSIPNDAHNQERQKNPNKVKTQDQWTIEDYKKELTMVRELSANYADKNRNNVAEVKRLLDVIEDLKAEIASYKEKDIIVQKQVEAKKDRVSQERAMIDARVKGLMPKGAKGARGLERTVCENYLEQGIICQETYDSYNLDEVGRH